MAHSDTPEGVARPADFGTADSAAGVGDRFGRRRAEIIAAAIPILNRQGFKGMRLTAVAEQIGLRATGVTYYFARKEDLAVACMEAGLAVFHDLLDRAEREPTAAGRVRTLVAGYVARQAEVRQGRATPIASFGAMRSLEEPHFTNIYGSYREMFRRVRRLFLSPELPGLNKEARSYRALILLEQLWWASGLLEEYDLADFPRVAARIQDIVVGGLAAPGRQFDPGEMVIPAAVAGDGCGEGETSGYRESFLRAAIGQINAYGYRGASVDRIAASLNVTKGAFYHHNDAKDDLVAACFRRSLGLALSALIAAPGEDEWRRLTTAATELVRFQLGPDGPLLRSSALASMPQEYQREILQLSARLTRRLAAMISDGIAEGSVRPIDPMIAATLIIAAINAVSDVRFWPHEGEPDPQKYAALLFRGLASEV